MKAGQLQRKFDKGSTEGRWIVMDVPQESWKVFHTDSTRRLASLVRSDSVECERLRESDCA